MGPTVIMSNVCWSNMDRYYATILSSHHMGTLNLRDGLFARIKLSPFDEYGNWILLEDFTYYIWEKWSSEPIRIPAGFIFNGMSIPRFFWWAAHPLSCDTIVAALVHDYLFTTLMYSLERCDYIFYEVMEVCNVNPMKRVLLYVWLGFGSKYVYNKIASRKKKAIL